MPQILNPIYFTPMYIKVHIIYKNNIIISITYPRESTYCLIQVMATGNWLSSLSYFTANATEIFLLKFILFAKNKTQVDAKTVIEFCLVFYFKPAVYLQKTYNTWCQEFLRILSQFASGMKNFCPKFSTFYRFLQPSRDNIHSRGWSRGCIKLSVSLKSWHFTKNFRTILSHSAYYRLHNNF